MEHWQQHLPCRTQHQKIFENVQRSVRETDFFPWTNTEHEWCAGSRSGTDTSMVNSAPQQFLSIHLLLGWYANYAGVCRWLQPWLHILNDILRTNEAQFPQDSITNTINSHSKVYENPHDVAECHLQCHFSVSTLCGVLNLIWHVIKGWLTVPYYTNFL